MHTVSSMLRRCCHLHICVTGLAPRHFGDAWGMLANDPWGHGATGDTAGAEKGGPKAKSWRDEPVEKRLAHALVKGIDEFAVRVRTRQLF